MKYRQWKKNYKKKHGVNPPLWLDRKKRRRYIRKRVRRIAASLEVNVEIITKGLEASVMAIKKRLITLCWDNLEALCQDCHNKEHHKQERHKRYQFDENGGILPPYQKNN